MDFSKPKPRDVEVSLSTYISSTATVEDVMNGISNGYSVSQVDRNGDTPFIYSIYYQNKEIAKFLALQYGALKFNQAGTPLPLWVAVAKNDPEMVELLLNLGADINAPLTMPYYKKFSGLVDMIQTHINTPSDPRCYVDDTSNFPMILEIIQLGKSITFDADEVAKLYPVASLGIYFEGPSTTLSRSREEYGLDYEKSPMTGVGSSIPVIYPRRIRPNDTDSVFKLFDGTKQRFANPMSREHLHDFLKTHGTGHKGSPLEYIGLQHMMDLIDSDPNCFPKIKELVEAGVPVNMERPLSITPFQKAIKKHNLELVRYLVEKGARLDQSANAIPLPLWQAIEENDLEIFKFLLETGANPHWVTNTFWHVEFGDPLVYIEAHLSTPRHPRVREMETTNLQAMADLLVEHHPTLLPLVPTPFLQKYFQ